MKNHIKKKNYANPFAKLLAVGLLAASMISCKEEAPKVDTFHGTITFLRGETTVNGKAARIGLQLVDSDNIHVKSNSMSVIQFSNKAQVTIKENTQLIVARLFQNKDGVAEIALDQKTGATFHKIMPGKADYKLRTPTITAGVRGTSFSVDVDNKGSSDVKLLKGSVGVKKKEAERDPAAQEVVLEPGEKLLVPPGAPTSEDLQEKLAKPIKLNESEMDELEQLNAIAYLPANKLSAIEEADEKGLEELIQEMPEIVPPAVEKIIIPDVKPPALEEKPSPKADLAPPKPKKMTLKELKERHGDLTKVTTKDGSVYIGAFKQDAEQFEITTIDGIIKVQATEVENIEAYQED